MREVLLSTHRFNRELERVPMWFIGFAMEMKCMNKMGRINEDVFFRYALGNKSDVVGDADNAIVAVHLLIHLIVMNSIDPDGTLSLLVINLSLLDEA